MAQRKGGGGAASGIWLKNILRQLRCEYFINDGHFYRQAGDKRAYELFPSLRGPEETGPTQVLRRLPSRQWSEYGDISWEKLLPV